MDELLFKMKDIITKLDMCNNTNTAHQLINDLIEYAHIYKEKITLPPIQDSKNKNLSLNDSNLKIEKISEETFLYKPITVKNYYDGDYLENFCELRTSDLQYCGVIDTHNIFWGAHEVISGNIFATIPLELINESQSSKLQRLNWDTVETDIYEVKFMKEMPRHLIINNIDNLFDNYLLVREISGNIYMVLEFKI